MNQDRSIGACWDFVQGNVHGASLSSIGFIEVCGKTMFSPHDVVVVFLVDGYRLMVPFSNVPCLGLHFELQLFKQIYETLSNRGISEQEYSSILEALVVVCVESQVASEGKPGIVIEESYRRLQSSSG